MLPFSPRSLAPFTQKREGITLVINSLSGTGLHVDVESVIEFRGGVLIGRVRPYDHEKVKIEIGNNIAIIAWAREVRQVGLINP